MTVRLPPSLGREDVGRLLVRVHESARLAPIVDVHVHANEIFCRSSRVAGQSTSGAALPAAAGALRLDWGQHRGRLDSDARNRISEMMFVRAYAGVGPREFLAQMDLAGVHAALLLPVAAPEWDSEAAMAPLLPFREFSERFKLACACPDSVADGDLLGSLLEMKSLWGVEAVKVHPNVAGLDLRTSVGIARLEAILGAASAADLAVVVHGGRSPILGDVPAAEFARLSNLAGVDWSIAPRVSLAHLGVYGLDPDEVLEDLPRLQCLLARHPNLYADVSGLPAYAMMAMLPRLDFNRVLFGSDALYHSMYQMVVLLLHTLDSTVDDPEASFRQITGLNPCRFLKLDT